MPSRNDFVVTTVSYSHVIRYGFSPSENRDAVVDRYGDALSWKYNKNKRYEMFLNTLH